MVRGMAAPGAGRCEPVRKAWDGVWELPNPLRPNTAIESFAPEVSVRFARSAWLVSFSLLRMLSPLALPRAARCWVSPAHIRYLAPALFKTSVVLYHRVASYPAPDRNCKRAADAWYSEGGPRFRRTGPRLSAWESCLICLQCQCAHPLQPPSSWTALPLRLTCRTLQEPHFSCTLSNTAHKA